MMCDPEQEIIAAFSEMQRPGEAYIGDDCAVLEDAKLLITTDHFAEGHHFNLSFMTPHSVGWRLMAASASDIIAMGSRPDRFLLNIAVPDSRRGVLDGIRRGITDFVERYDISIIGGDTTAASSLFLGVTMFGPISRSVLKRSGARPGDSVFVVSNPAVGGACAGLLSLRNEEEGFPWARERFLYPDPFVTAPKNTDDISSAVDISDGLLHELYLLAEASHVTINVDISRLPTHREILRAAERFSRPADELRFIGGEEFTLLITSPRKEISGYIRTGTVEERRDEPVVLHENGVHRTVAYDRMFSHFS